MKLIIVENIQPITGKLLLVFNMICHQCNKTFKQSQSYEERYLCSMSCENRYWEKNKYRYKQEEDVNCSHCNKSVNMLEYVVVREEFYCNNECAKHSLY
jgi:hypothetical protein